MSVRHEAIWEAIVEDGRARLEDEAGYRKWFARAFGDGEEVEVVVRRRRKQRSSPTNRYWWGVVIKTLAMELGYADPEELHDAVVLKFRPADPDPITGVPRRERTYDKDGVWFSDLISEVRMWAEADLGIYIPLPNEAEAA